MPEQITTFRDTYPDGLQLHESTTGVAVRELSEELINEIGLAGEGFNQAESGNKVSLGMGLWIPGARALNVLPKPNYTDRQDPNIGLFPMLDAFGKFVFTNRDEILGGLRPSYVRVLAIGPDAQKVNSWHCDPLVASTEGYCLSITPPNVGRIVVGVDGRLRSNSGANIRFVDGSFVVTDVVAERKDCKTKDWQDLYRGYPEGSTLVTRESGSVIEIGDTSFEPPQESVRRFDDLVLTKLGCTSLHAATPSTDSVRFSLQCFYDGVEKA
ncbi:MAG TPA: hypothetical protein VMR76_00665 [Candidatus Saccharimonadia bacterium]|nr:hypothetical protein [Candidatus Saccharimonadia bacterium]